MATLYDELTPKLIEWIGRQQMFFVASAPLAGDGLINCSPKGLDALRILDAHSVAYLDLTGSGAETIAHTRENGRLLIMFCAFEGAANIVRLWGTATPYFPGAPDFEALRPLFPDLPGIRSIIKLDVERIQDSCGFGVPLYDYKGQRPTLVKHWANQGEAAVADYQRLNNRTSLDGLPALSDAEI